MAWSGVSYSLTSPINLLGARVFAYAGTRRAPGCYRDCDGRLWLEVTVTANAAINVGDKLTNAPAGGGYGVRLATRSASQTAAAEESGFCSDLPGRFSSRARQTLAQKFLSTARAFSLGKMDTRWA
jgi:hypothetical protein